MLAVHLPMLANLTSGITQVLLMVSSVYLTPPLMMECGITLRLEEMAPRANSSSTESLIQPLVLLAQLRITSQETCLWDTIREMLHQIQITTMVKWMKSVFGVKQELKTRFENTCSSLCSDKNRISRRTIR